jgi:hypothetical protein
MELVDLILITKADGELMSEVRRLKTEWSSALRLMRRRSTHWTPKVNSHCVYIVFLVDTIELRSCRFQHVRTRVLIKLGHKCPPIKRL